MCTHTHTHIHRGIILASQTRLSSFYLVDFFPCIVVSSLGNLVVKPSSGLYCRLKAVIIR
jgi:hypothetical protein